MADVSITVRLDDIDRVQSQLRGAENALRNLANQAPASRGKFLSLNSAFTATHTTLGKIERGLFSMKGALAGLGIGLFVKEVVQAEFAMDRITNSLAAATGGVQEGAAEFEFLRETTERLGINLSKTASDYAQLAAAAKGTTLEGQATRDIFEAVAKAAVVMGLSADQTRGTIIALQQMISKGNVSAEELRRQLGDRLPGAFQLAARSIGVTTKELNKLLDSGSLTATELLPALTIELNKTFGPQLEGALEASLRSFERFNNAIFLLKVELAKGGFVEEFTKVLKRLTNVLKDPDTIANVQAFSAILGDIIVFLAENTKEVLASVAAYTALRIAMGLVVTTKLPVYLKIILPLLAAAGVGIAALEATNLALAESQADVEDGLLAQRNALADLRIEMASIEAALQTSQDAYDTVNDRIKDHTDLTINEKNVLSAAGNIVNLYAQQLSVLEEREADLVAAIAAVTEATTDQTVAVEKTTLKLGDWFNSIGALGLPLTGQWIKKTQEAEVSIASLGLTIHPVRDALDALAVAEANATGAAEDFHLELGFVNDKLEPLPKFMEAVGIAIDKHFQSSGDSVQLFADAVTDSFDKVRDTIKEFILTGKLDLGDFFDFVKAKIAEMIATDIAGSLFNVIGSVVPGNLGTAIGAAGSASGGSIGGGGIVGSLVSGIFGGGGTAAAAASPFAIAGGGAGMTGITMTPVATGATLSSGTSGAAAGLGGIGLGSLAVLGPAALMAAVILMSGGSSGGLNPETWQKVMVQLVSNANSGEPLFGGNIQSILGDDGQGFSQQSYGFFNQMLQQVPNFPGITPEGAARATAAMNGLKPFLAYEKAMTIVASDLRNGEENPDMPTPPSGSFDIKSFATGGQQAFATPTMIQVGDAGPEVVSVSPMHGGRTGMGGGVIVNINSPSIFDDMSARQFARIISESMATRRSRSLG